MTLERVHPEPKDMAPSNQTSDKALDKERENAPSRQRLPRPGSLATAHRDDYSLSGLQSLNSVQPGSSSKKDAEVRTSATTDSWACEKKQNLVWQIAGEKAGIYQCETRSDQMESAVIALNEIPDRIEEIVTETVKKLVEKQKDVDPLNTSTAPKLGPAYSNCEAEVHKIWKHNVSKSGQYNKHANKIQREISRALTEGGHGTPGVIFDAFQNSGAASRRPNRLLDSGPNSDKKLQDQQPPNHGSSTTSSQSSGSREAPISTTTTDIHKDPPIRSRTPLLPPGDLEGDAMEMKARKVEFGKELGDRRNRRKEAITNTELYQEFKNITSVVQSQATKTISKLLNEASISSSTIAGASLPTILEDMEEVIASDIGVVVNRFVASVQGMDVDLRNRSLSDALLRAKGVSNQDKQEISANRTAELRENTRDGGFRKLFNSGLSGAELSSDPAAKVSVAKAFIESSDWTDANEYSRYKKGEMWDNRIRDTFGRPQGDSSSSHKQNCQASPEGDTGGAESSDRKYRMWNDLNTRRTEPGNQPKRNPGERKLQTEEETGIDKADEKLLYSGSMSRKRLDDHLDTIYQERKLKDKSVEMPHRIPKEKYVTGIDSHINTPENKATTHHDKAVAQGYIATSIGTSISRQKPRYIPPHNRGGYGSSSSSKDLPNMKLEKSLANSQDAHDLNQTISRELSMNSGMYVRSDCSVTSNKAMDANKARQARSIQHLHHERSNASWADMSEDWDGNDFINLSERASSIGTPSSRSANISAETSLASLTASVCGDERSSDGEKRSSGRGRSRGRGRRNRDKTTTGSHSQNGQRASGIEQECDDASEHQEDMEAAGEEEGSIRHSTPMESHFLLPREAYSDDDETYHRKSLGSKGHPDFCARPCLYFWKGACNNGDNCPFCHHPHRKRPTRLNKRHRQILEKLAREKAYNMLVPVILEKSEKYNAAEKMRILLERVTHGPRPPQTVKEKCIVEVIKTMPLGHIIQLFRRLCLNKMDEEQKEAFELVMKDVTLLVEVLKAGRQKVKSERSNSF